MNDDSGRIVRLLKSIEIGVFLAVMLLTIIAVFHVLNFVDDVAHRPHIQPAVTAPESPRPRGDQP